MMPDGLMPAKAMISLSTAIPIVYWSRVSMMR